MRTNGPAISTAIASSPQPSGDTHDNWLLVKERDEAARRGSGAAVVDDHPLSVESGRTLARLFHISIQMASARGCLSPWRTG